MENKHYQLVAFSSEGKVRMVPSLLAEKARPFLERIESRKDIRAFTDEEVPRILELSRAYGEYGDFLMRSALPMEAFLQYVEASAVCLYGTDCCWIYSDYGYRPCGKLMGRFLEMYGICRRMLDVYPDLASLGKWKFLHGEYLDLTMEERRYRKEFDDGWADFKAWQFGE